MLSIVALIATPNHLPAQSLTRTAHVGGSINCVAVSGTMAYAGQGTMLKIINTSSPSNPVVVGSVNLSGFCHGVARTGNHVYCALLDQGMQVVNVADPSNPLVTYTYSASKEADPTVWWTHVTIAGNRAYAASGNGGPHSGIHVFDTTSPGQPVLLGHFANTLSWATDLAIHGNYLYAAYSDLPELQIIDVSAPHSMHEVARFDVGANAANRGIVIDGNHAYVATSVHHGMVVIDIANPIAPIRIGSYDTPNVATSIAKSGNSVYVADMWDSPGVIVISTANPSAPSLSSTLNTGGVASGRLLVDGSRLYVPNLNALRIYDISTPATPSYLGQYQGSPYLAMPWGLKVHSSHAYVCDFRAGLRIFDVSGVVPVYTGGFRTTAEACGVEIVDNTAYVCNAWGNSIDVMNVTNKSMPTRLSTLNFPVSGTIENAVASGQHLYIAAGRAGFHVLDISNRTSPQHIRTVSTDDYAGDLAVDGTRLTVADANGGWRLYSISNPSTPSLLSKTQGVGRVTGIAASGNRVVVSINGPNREIRTYNTANPATPQLLAVLPAPYPETLKIAGNFAFVSNHKYGLYVYDISNMSTPFLHDSFDTEVVPAREFAIEQNRVFSGDMLGGLNVFSFESSVSDWPMY